MDATRDCGTFTEDQIAAASRAEAEAHYWIWRNQHITLPTKERVVRILETLGANLAPPTIDQISTAYEEGILQRPPMLVPGAYAALAALSSRYRLAIISDTGFSPGRVLTKVLADSGILPAFESLLFSDEAGCSKPHPEVFRRTAARLAVEPHRMAHVGDLEHTDIVGAKAAGYRAIRFAAVTPLEPGEETIADRVALDWNEIPGIVERF